jgi:REP element-mobilizing transposase RayT
MVIAYHLVWTIYGTWLPNDPRGSGSHIIAAPLLAELGELHYGRKAVQPSRKEISDFYSQAEQRLLFPVSWLSPQQIDLVAIAFADTIREHQYTCYACAIMPDHVHIVIRKHRHLAEEMIDNLQIASRAQLLTTCDFAANHPIWTLGGWKRFLNSPADVRRVIPYVEQNPTAVGMPKRQWPFVTAYDNWPFHRRHA